MNITDHIWDKDSDYIDTYVQYTRTDSVRIFDLRFLRTEKAVTNREHLSYGPHISFSSPGLHLIKDRAPWALTVRTFRSVRLQNGKLTLNRVR